MTSRNWHLVVCLSFLLTGIAPADPRQEIEKAYSRLSHAWSLKFVDGIWSVRSPNFRLIDAEGVFVSEGLELRRVESLLATCLKITDKIQILEYRRLSKEAVVCQARYLAQARRFTRDPKMLVDWT